MTEQQRIRVHAHLLNVNGKMAFEVGARLSCQASFIRGACARPDEIRSKRAAWVRLLA